MNPLKTHCARSGAASPRTTSAWLVCSLFLTGLFQSPALLAQGDRPLPADAGIIDVTKAPYRANGSDTKDDTEAIQAAIRAAMGEPGHRYFSPRFVYFPRGTYLISNTLEGRSEKKEFSNGWLAGMILVGESQTGTVIKLIDKAPGYNKPVTPKAMIMTGSEDIDKNFSGQGDGNQAFRHYILNLTLHTGNGNPGATAIDYICNNRGAVQDVTIRSGDGAGVAGISMRRAWPGPALIKNVRITGFDYGVWIEQYQYGMTFEHLSLSGQKKAGLYNKQNVLAIRGLVSENRVPALKSDEGHIVIIDSQLKGGAAANAAIVSGKTTLFVRNVTNNGYGKAVDGESTRDATGAQVTEFVSNTIESLFEGPRKSLGLPIEETPAYYPRDLSQWANVVTFGATLNQDSDDDADAIQKAIDSKKAVVYLPSGLYHVSRPIIIRGSVRKITGMSSSIGKTADFKGEALLRFEDGTPATVTLEHLHVDGQILHASSRALVLKHLDHDGYQTTPDNRGKLYVEDVIGKPYVINGPQKVWARQLNAEFGNDPLFQNYGGTAWILGMKTEGEATVIKTVRGTTEVLGALVYPLKEVSQNVPMFISEESNVSFIYRSNGDNYFPTQVNESRKGVRKNLMKKDLPGFNTSFYVGYETETKAKPSNK
ncbi:MAG: hypothetical protein H7Z75_08420 [Ferruginibacter sp.]|nr:hypothetical protein [Cytophagales bacterium]